MKRLIVFVPLLLTGCQTTKRIIMAPVAGVKNLFSIGPAPVVDPYAIWQEYALYIVIGGIIIGVIDFYMDRKLTLIGPAIAVCGLCVSIWGVTLAIVGKTLPYALGLGIAFWVYTRWAATRRT